MLGIEKAVVDFNHLAQFTICHEIWCYRNLPDVNGCTKTCSNTFWRILT